MAPTAASDANVEKTTLGITRKTPDGGSTFEDQRTAKRNLGQRVSYRSVVAPRNLQGDVGEAFRCAQIAPS